MIQERHVKVKQNKYGGIGEQENAAGCGPAIGRVGTDMSPQNKD